MKIFNLGNHPLVKVVGISAILYFALFANKENPESLGNRLSSEKIKKNVSEVKEKSHFIITNLEMAHRAAAQQHQTEQKPKLIEESIEKKTETQDPVKNKNIGHNSKTSKATSH